jgi:hypothetical protein
MARTPPKKWEKEKSLKKRKKWQAHLAYMARTLKDIDARRYQ